jgi:hypothetical protein
VGQEQLEQSDLEMVRGSSATLDQQIVSEDVSQSFVVDNSNPLVPVLGPTDGTFTTVRVRNYPIVDGQGFGRVTNDVRSVSATVNGTPVAIGSVQGTNGYITFQVPPQVGDDVRVTYYFHRGDTAFTDTVSDQVTPTTADLTTPAVANFAFTTGISDTFVIGVDGTDSTVVFTEGIHTALAVKTMIDAALITGLTTAVFTDNEGNDHVTLTAAQKLVIGTGNANGALGFTAGASTSRNVNFRVFQRPIVDGTDGGITTTDPSKVVVLVNNSQVIPTAVDGTNGIVTLPMAPAAGSTVTIQYWANTWQDTFDYLPNTLVSTVTRCGFSPGRSDYIQNQDFVISNPSEDVSVVHWGSSVAVSSVLRTAGATVFDETQILASLVDDKMYLAECTRVVDTTVVPAETSPNEFLLPAIPTTGNGRDTPLGSTLYNTVTNGRMNLNTDRPDLITVYTGRDLRDALGRDPIDVIEVDALNRQITLKQAVPPDHNAYATFWYSRLSDDTYVLTNKVAGAVGTGEYEVFSSVQNNNLLQVLFGSKTATEVIQWPRGVESIPDAFHTGTGTGSPVAETVTVTFASEAAKNAAYTNEGAAPYEFFAGTSDQWVTVLNGVTYPTDLDTAVVGRIVGTRVAVDGSDQITFTTGVNDVLNLTIDGTDYTVTFSAGATAVGPVGTPGTVLAQIAAVIPTTPELVQLGPSGSDVMFIIPSSSTPAALPGGFDHVSAVSVRQGTAETTLGFVPFQSASGTPTATNKPATLLGTETGDFIITLGVNDEFKFRVDGLEYTVTLTAGTRTATQVVSDITGVVAGVASVGTLANLDKVRLTSTTTNSGSRIVILDGSANDTLGFTEDDSASYTPVTAQEVVNELLATASFQTDGVAYVSTINGSQYVTIESSDVGATTPSASSIAFTSVSNSAFNTTTGTGIEPGTSGDNGEDARDIYTVATDRTDGLGSGGTGVPGQTYTDAKTGLRFTVLESATGSYTPGGTFTLTVSPTWKVHPSIPSLQLGGLEVIVTDTVGVGVDDTANVQAFNPGGSEPAVGDFYYISYQYLKQDFSTRLFQTFKVIEANFGRLSPENRVTLASFLAILNGAVLVGIKQVLKESNTNQASDASFLAALQELTIPLPGNVKPDVLVPLTTSTTVYGALMQHCEVQSNIRNQAERMGFIGFASGTSPITAQTIAKSLLSNRIVAVYPDSAVITVTNELGESSESLVDGTFLASALAGAIVSPAVDVATPYTRRQLVGIDRLPRVLDPVEASQTAVAGITVLEDLATTVRVKQGLTTDMSTILTRLPTVTQIADFVQQQSRATLDAFVGTKFLSQRTNEVEVSMTSLFNQMLQAEIVGGFTGINAEVDPNDPTIMRFEAFYAPIFPLLYIVLTFNLRANV